MASNKLNKFVSKENDGKEINQLDQKIREKRPGLNKKKIIFHQDNAHAHTCLTSLSKISSLRYELLPNPSYSSDLALSDFYLFSRFEIFLSRRRFSSIEKLQKTVDDYSESFEENHFKKGIEAMESRWKKCIKPEEDNVE
ncbi:Hypothetical protein SRAE_X000125300 [Strongyloides ratti]|uniref:Histone-lysine N-methyltransferase SETMAR n=1 Tax=Strongyloides ratti TaxID=34506 RepID=A0A090MN69_STRRB|nr:Hypothetical protein SRAE_X000125300 [Strongyloides ratti]CEF59506.1 Hypothetical protein SRAE_X000125300 [Strongyloides ratti]